MTKNLQIVNKMKYEHKKKFWLSKTYCHGFKSWRPTKSANFSQTMIIGINNLTFFFLSAQCKLYKNYFTINVQKWSHDFIIDVQNWSHDLQNVSFLFHSITHTFTDSRSILCVVVQIVPNKLIWHTVKRKQREISHSRSISCVVIQTKVSERLLFNANSPIFQLYHGENKLIFNEMMMRSTLY